MKSQEMCPCAKEKKSPTHFASRHRNLFKPAGTRLNASVECRWGVVGKRTVLGWGGADSAVLSSPDASYGGILPALPAIGV